MAGAKWANVNAHSGASASRRGVTLLVSPSFGEALKAGKKERCAVIGVGGLTILWLDQLWTRREPRAGWVLGGPAGSAGVGPLFAQRLLRERTFMDRGDEIAW
jgi:hypothetical protein